MRSSCEELTVDFDCQDTTAQNQEKIFVSIRLRPLVQREISKNDVSQWESLNSTTILFRNALQERTMLPVTYTFDRVFGCESPTRQVYDEGAKKIALSVLNGMNSTMFAYGQTSSGKTYTMSGITEYTIADIFDYINTHSERVFVLRFSAMEIYNEAVRDLLVLDSPPLRLLDDPERGTVVDKLTEVMVSDPNHLSELLSICEAQRQIGETTLNEVSSRSHQILRLTVESEARGNHVVGSSSLLTASASFVDLAGSERASQTLSAGTRLKEGCHINRSLLTLGTVIRKLSKGRNTHIPYRDSKLTRILQNSLGGNARTAIICTMSPAHSHLEQSRNTLLFASCAKQVSTNAQVNVVMSEKALVKNLQKELARLEGELRKVGSLSSSCGSSTELREKELLIQKMDKDIKELTHQRDLAQARVEEMLRSALEVDDHTSRSWVDMHRYEKSSRTSEYTPSEASDTTDPFRSDIASRVSHLSERYVRLLSSRIEDQFPDNNEDQFLSDDTSPGLYIDKYFGPDPCLGWEKITQESNKEFEDNKGDQVQSPYSPDIRNMIPGPPSSHVNLRSPIDDVYYFTGRDTVSCPPSPPKDDQVSDQSPCSTDSYSSDTSANVPRSKSCEAILTTLTKSSSSELSKGIENTSQGEEDDQDKTLSNPETVAKSENMCKEDSQNSNRSDDWLDEEEEIILKSDKDHTDKQPELNEAIERKSLRHVDNDLVGMSPRVSLQDIGKEKTSNKPEETMGDGSDKTQDTRQSSASDWHAEFERQKQTIIELWDACHIPLVHRTYFFLLFKGDPSDAVYMEVELRRLSFLKNTIHGVCAATDDQFSAQASSAKALNQERKRLSQQMLKKYSTKEREALYQKWGFNVKSKQRRLQLCRRLWTDTTDTEHITESAAIIAKLVGFKEPGQTHKEMFGLSFLPASSHTSLFR